MARGLPWQTSKAVCVAPPADIQRAEVLGVGLAEPGRSRQPSGEQAHWQHRLWSSPLDRQILKSYCLLLELIKKVNYDTNL